MTLLSRISITSIFAAALVVTLAPSADAVDSCKVKVDKKTGVIAVSAKNIVGSAGWAGESGAMGTPFFNAGDCLANGAAKKCQIGDPATLAAKTAPAGCTLFVSDDEGECDVWVPACSPGLRDAETGAAGAPVGFVSASASETAPEGWLVCDGSAVSRTTYADLFAAIGEQHGNGDGTTTFNLPDYRGMFLRGWDNGAGIDIEAAARTAMAAGGSTGDRVGSVQTDATAVPTNPFTTSTDGAHSHEYRHTPGVLFTDFGPEGFEGNEWLILDDPADTSTDGAHTHDVAAGGDVESRPVNASVLYVIKH